MERYFAFISYRHNPGEQQISLQLRRKLENWHLPKASALDRKRRVFRDKDELPTSSDLGTDIENALKESGFLICLCSEDYMGSLWCLKEVEVYLKLGRKDRILPVLVSGTPEKSIPESIRDLPVIADLRDTSGRKRAAALDECAASILGCAAGEDAKEYAASERRNRLMVRGGVFAAVLAGVLGFAGYASVTANRIAGNNREIAAATARTREARDAAVEERNRAILTNARFLSERAWTAIDSQEDIAAVLLALEALPEDLHGDAPVSEEAISALRAAVSMPAAPKDNWTYSKSYETDFTITGYLSSENTDSSAGVLLLDDEDGPFEYYLTYETGEIVPVESAAKKNAAEAGYSMGYIGGRGSQTVFYGPDKPLTTNNGYKKSLEENRITLNGAYIYADHVLECGESSYMLAWNENPLSGQQQTAFFYIGETEAFGLDMEGLPVSAGLSDNYSRIAVVNDKGTIYLFETDTGRKKAVLPGEWTKVYYPDSSTCFCAADASGDAYLINAVTLEKEYRFPSPAPVLSLQYCSQKELFLLLCADGGIRIVSLDGRLVKEIFPEEMPIDVFWEGYEQQLWRHLGNSFCLLYENRVDLYEIEADSSMEATDYFPLYEQGVVYETAYAFYSPDSKYIYLQQYGGQVSKWDVKTGRFIWNNDSRWTLQGNAHDFCCLSRDGNAVWRATSYMDGLEKIDAETGETLWSVSWKDCARDRLMPKEYPDGKNEIAFSPAEYGSDIVAFNPETGEEYWVKTDMEKACWSADGSQILSVNRYWDKDADKAGIRYIRLAAKDGSVLEDTILLEEPYKSPTRYVQVCEEQQKFSLTSHPETENGQGTYIEVYSLPDGRFLDSWDLEEYCDFVFSYTGEMAVRWTAAEEETEYCKTLEAGGSFGTAVYTDSERGRMLTAMQAKDPLMELRDEANASQHVVFGGYDAALNNVRLELDDLKIIRISDGITLLNFKYSRIAVGAAVAPDGESLCIYGYYTTPRIIRASDPDTLVQKANTKLSQQSPAYLEELRQEYGIGEGD